MVFILGGFICTLFLLISLSITLQTSKFRNQFTISLKYFDMACYLKRESYSGPISFEVLRNDTFGLGEVQMKPCCTKELFIQLKAAPLSVT